MFAQPGTGRAFRALAASAAPPTAASATAAAAPPAAYSAPMAASPQPAGMMPYGAPNPATAYPGPPPPMYGSVPTNPYAAVPQQYNQPQYGQQYNRRVCPGRSRSPAAAPCLLPLGRPATRSQPPPCRCKRPAACRAWRHRPSCPWQRVPRAATPSHPRLALRLLRSPCRMRAAGVPPTMRQWSRSGRCSSRTARPLHSPRPPLPWRRALARCRPMLRRSMLTLMLWWGRGSEVALMVVGDVWVVMDEGGREVGWGWILLLTGVGCIRGSGWLGLG